MNKQRKYTVILLVLITGCQCSSPKEQSFELQSIDELKMENETDLEAYQRIEAELQYRRLSDASDSATIQEVDDSVLVIGDTIRWRLVKRRLESDPQLKGYSTKSLLSLYGPKVNYGPDDRKDWFETDSISKNIAQQTVCLIKRRNLKRQQDGSYKITAPLFRQAQYLCTTERFHDQPVAGFCSGFAVSKRLMVTAGHCLQGINLSEFVMVFDFFKSDSVSSTIKTVFQANELYTATQVVRSALDQNNDYAVIRVDRDIPAHRIAKVRTAPVRLNEPVYVIGYPCGLPVKVAKEATVVNNQYPDFFLADVDTYGGNSGSPVYDSTHTVIGILVRGARDFNFDYSKNCYFSNVCTSLTQPNCEGEHISRTHQFVNYIIN